MSGRVDRFSLPVSELTALGCCQDAAAQRGWRIVTASPTHLRCKEPAGQGLFAWPVNVDISLAASDSGTEVALNGSVLGLGPFQSDHLRQEMEALRRTVQHLAEAAVNDADGTSELVRLDRLRACGAITDGEFTAARRELISKRQRNEPTSES